MLYCKKKQEKTNMEQLDKEERWNKKSEITEKRRQWP
jgi:hypothetical protein